MFRLVLLSCLVCNLAFAYQFGVWSSNRLHGSSAERIGRVELQSQLHARSSRSSKCLPNASRQQNPLYLVATNDGTAFSSTNGNFDGSAVVKYGVAIAIQMGLATALLRTMDLLVSYAKIQKVPFAVNFALFYGMSLKSRIFNPMSNTRPQVKTLEAEVNSDVASTSETKKKDIATIFRRKMPSWTPPGIVFPIVWLLIIGPIRAATTSMIYQTVGSYASVPILSLLLHLSIGDVWNTINNIERRFGVAVTVVFCVWLSKAHTAYQYSLVNPFAGKLLGATLIWLTIASALVTATWRLNPDPDTGKLDPLYPVVGKATTKFAWFSKKS
jgi:translocator protein